MKFFQFSKECSVPMRILALYAQWLYVSLHIFRQLILISKITFEIRSNNGIFKLNMVGQYQNEKDKIKEKWALTLYSLIPTKVWVPGDTANPWSFIWGTSTWSCSNIYNIPSHDLWLLEWHTVYCDRKIIYLDTSINLWTSHDFILFYI